VTAAVVQDNFLRRWFVCVTLAEAAGFAVPATVLGSLALLGAPAAAAAWSIGMLPSTLGVGFGLPVVILLAAVLGTALLLSIPTLQWLVLRQLAPQRRTAFWIPVNAGAWGVGLLWTFAPSPFIDETTPVPVLFAVYLLAGLLMAATVAVLTGFAARRIVLAAPSHQVV
jgi:hypothetical protein